jgi:hypothetical protein
MSKTGSWILGMQEDATWMSRDVFIRVHGVSNVDLFDRFHSYQEEWDYEQETTEEILETN